MIKILLISLLLSSSLLAKTRGERNYNPGNLRSNKILIGEVTKDKDGFSIFKNNIEGLRAIVRTLKVYNKNGYNTPYKIITRYTNKDTSDRTDYINCLCRKLKINKHDKINLYNTKNLYLITKCIVKFEGQKLPEKYYKKVFYMKEYEYEKG